MRVAVFVAVLLCSAQAVAQLPPADKVPDYLQEISVTIKADNAEGSGVVKTRVIDGKAVNFVWTAAHVVDGLRSTEEVVDPKTGTKRIKVSFRDPGIVKELVEEGRRVGDLRMDATVIRYSKDEDLAILRIRKRDFVKASVVFYLEEKIPAVGTDLYHVGSLLGQMGSNSLTSGIVSQIGRTIDKWEYDQTTCTAFPGSSGGGVYLRDGHYIGMLVRGAGEGFNLSVPVRRMVKWSKAANVYWALDDKAPSPTQAELDKLPIEDTGASFDAAKENKEFPTLIRITPPNKTVYIEPIVDPLAPGVPQRTP